MNSIASMAIKTIRETMVDIKGPDFGGNKRCFVQDRVGHGWDIMFGSPSPRDPFKFQSIAQAGDTANRVIAKNQVRIKATDFFILPLRS